MIDPTCRILGELVPLTKAFRIDAFCVLTGRVEINDRVHVSSGSRLLGANGGIILGEGSAVSVGCSILTASDDFAASVGIGPLFPESLRQVKTGRVIFEAMSACGAHSVVMPGCTLGFGARLGANSFLTESIPAGEIWAGTPARRVGAINLELLKSLYREVFG